MWRASRRDWSEVPRIALTLPRLANTAVLGSGIRSDCSQLGGTSLQSRGRLRGVQCFRRFGPNSRS